MKLPRKHVVRERAVTSSLQRYVLSSAVITAPGTYEYRLLTPETARRWLDRGGFTSLVGYDVTASAMEMLLGVRPAVSREHARMEIGDEALVFRLRARVTSSQIKHNLTPDFVFQHAEIGLLRRIR